jgi:tetratricopeptide (TPR) repeat protein
VAAPGGIGPRFAERAAVLLEKGDVPAALSLLLAGMKEYPAYATAHHLLGQCYERLGKRDDAARQFAQVRRALPGLPGGETGATARGESGVDFMLRQLSHVQLRPDITATAGPDVPATGVQGHEHGEQETAEGTAPIVSATLAEIYADQGKYREAVEAYNRLVQQRPAEAGRYRERLAELERLLQGVDKPGEA